MGSFAKCFICCFYTTILVICNHHSHVHWMEWNVMSQACQYSIIPSLEFTFCCGHVLELFIFIVFVGYYSMFYSSSSSIKLPCFSAYEFKLTKLKIRYICFNWKKQLYNQNKHYVEHMVYVACTWNYLIYMMWLKSMQLKSII